MKKNILRNLSIAMSIISAVAILIFFIVIIVRSVGASSYDYYDFGYNSYNSYNGIGFVGYFFLYLLLYTLYWPLLIASLVVNIININKVSKGLTITSLVLFSVMLVTGFTVFSNWLLIIAGFVLALVALVNYNKFTKVDNTNTFQHGDYTVGDNNQ